MGGVYQKVDVVGLRAFVKTLKEVDAKYPNQIRQANFDVARGIRDAARVRATTRLEKRVALRGLRALRSRSEAAVILGGPNSPEAFGAEFGARRYKQFRSWRGNQFGGWEGGPGYFLHPAIREEGPYLIREYAKRLDALAAEAFPE